MQIKQILTAAIIALLCIFSLPTTTHATMHTAAEVEIADSQHSILFIIDVSGSMNVQDSENLVAETVKMFIDTLCTQSTEIGFISFNDAIVAEFPLTPIDHPATRQQLREAIEMLVIQGSADIGYALHHGVQMISTSTSSDSSNTQPIIILFSDGDSREYSSIDENYTLNRAMQSNIPIHTIGISHDGSLNTEYLMEISRATNGRHYVIRNAHALPSIFAELIHEISESHINQGTVITVESGWQYITIDTLGAYASEVNIILHNDPGALQSTVVLHGNSVMLHDNATVYNSTHFTSIKVNDPTENEVFVSLYSAVGNVIRYTVINHISIQPQIEFPHLESGAREITILAKLLLPISHSNQSLCFQLKVQLIQNTIMIDIFII